MVAGNTKIVNLSLNLLNDFILSQKHNIVTINISWCFGKNLTL